MTDLRLRIFALYLRAAGVGSGPSQYQWMVLRLTSFAQVLSSGLVFEKFFFKEAKLFNANLWTPSDWKRMMVKSWLKRKI